MSFATILQELMRENGMTNYRLSKTMKCSATTVQNWISGKTVPHKGMISQLADVFSVPSSYLSEETDRYGISTDEWRMMGRLCKSHRLSNGKTLQDAVDGDVVSAGDLEHFEEKGAPLNPRQIEIVCGMLGTNPLVLFNIWADKLYGQKNKSGAVRQATDDEIKAALWGNEDDLTEADVDELWEDVKTYAAFKTMQRKKRK